MVFTNYIFWWFLFVAYMTGGGVSEGVAILCKKSCLPCPLTCFKVSSRFPVVFESDAIFGLGLCGSALSWVAQRLNRLVSKSLLPISSG